MDRVNGRGGSGRTLLSLKRSSSVVGVGVAVGVFVSVGVPGVVPAVAVEADFFRDALRLTGTGGGAASGEEGPLRMYRMPAVRSLLLRAGSGDRCNCCRRLELLTLLLLRLVIA